MIIGILIGVLIGFCLGVYGSVGCINKKGYRTFHEIPYKSISIDIGTIQKAKDKLDHE